MATMNDLYDYLQDLVLTKEYKNKNLQKRMKIEFGKKGLAINTPMLLFGENLSITEISQMELICFTQVVYDELGIEVLNPKKYFSNNELSNYKYYMNVDIKPEKIIFNHVFKDPNRISYMANYVPVEYLASLMENRLIRYNHETQRQATFKRRRNGKYFREITLNKKSVDEIVEEMLNGKFPSNQISFNILLAEGKIPQISYNEREMKLEIKPELDIDSLYMTPVDATDGWHRLSACVIASQKAKELGIELNSTLTVRIEMMTLEEAKEDLERNSKQNPIDLSYIDSMKDKGFNELIEEMNRYSSRDKNIFYNNIAKTSYEKKQTNKIITVKIINKLFQEYKVKTNNVIESKIFAQKICKIVTDLNDIYEDRSIKDLLEYALTIKDIEGILQNSDEYLYKIEQFEKRIEVALSE